MGPSGRACVGLHAPATPGSALGHAGHVHARTHPKATCRFTAAAAHRYTGRRTSALMAVATCTRSSSGS